MDCSKLNEIFNIDGPDWIEDDEEVVRYEGMSRERILERRRELYAENREKINERRRAYKEKDGVREMLRKSDNEWYAKNKESKRERRRELYAENREKVLEQKKAQYQKHKVKMQQKGREYYWNKKEKTVI